MNAARKFLFDRSFDEAKEPVKAVEEVAEEAPEPEVVVPTFSEEQMQAARAEAMAAGKEEGIREAAETTENRILETLTGLSGRISELFQAQEAANASTVESAISVAVSIARKVFPALNERHALGEIERMAVTAMEKVLEEPRVVIYVNPEMAPPLNERLEVLAAQAGYKGRVEVKSLDDIPVGDCRVEWSGGGATRDTAVLWSDIDEIVERNLAMTEDELADEAQTTAEIPPEALDVPEAAEPPDSLESAEAAEAESAAPEAAEAESAAPEAPEPPDTAEAKSEIEPAEPAPEDTAPEDTATTPDVDPSPENAILDGTTAADETPADETPTPAETPPEIDAAPPDESAEAPQADVTAAADDGGDMAAEAEPQSPDESPVESPEETPDATDGPGDDTATDREEP